MKTQTERAIFILKKYIYIEPKFTEKKNPIMQSANMGGCTTAFCNDNCLLPLQIYKFKAENDFIYIPYSHLMYKQ